MITINLSPEQHRLLLDGLTIADKVMQYGEYTDHAKRFKRLLDEIDFTQDSLDQENVLSLIGEAEVKKGSVSL